MKFMDGISLKQSNVTGVVQGLHDIARQLREVPNESIHVTDSNGHPVDRVKLFEETLTDGSKVYTVELHTDRD